MPLAALGILSTLFLLSRSVDPTTTIPFSDIDLAERARDEQLTAPFFAGATKGGALISFTAEVAHPDPTSPSRATATNLSARIDLTSGSTISFASESGLVDEPADLARLEGSVVVHSSTGYTIKTDALNSGIRELRAETDGQVQAEGPPGRFTAGKMLLTSNSEQGTAHLVFTNGVKLVYEPQG